MEDFSTSLLREKIAFIDDNTPPDTDVPDDGPNVVRSNRVFLKLGTEKVVTRAQNMHTTLRLAGKVMADYYKNGAFTPRLDKLAFDAEWAGIMSNYEREFNPYNWAAVYVNGQPAFRTKTSPFVDVVEKCALLASDNYDATMKVTHAALQKLGRAVRIEHTTSVAAVLTDNGKNIRCGIIYRDGKRDVTFQFTAVGGDQRNRVVQGMGIAAALLEAINLRFVVDTLGAKLGEGGSGMKGSADANQHRAATGRLVALDKGIMAFEENYEVRYRPEKPDFFNKD
jgi:hypothetical protein